MPYRRESAALSRSSPQVAPGMEVAYFRGSRRGLPPIQWRVWLGPLGVRGPTPRRRCSARTRRGLEERFLSLFHRFCLSCPLLMEFISSIWKMPSDI